MRNPEELGREAFGAEFVGAAGFLDTLTYGLPPRFIVDALGGYLRAWEQGRLEVGAFDAPMTAGRAAYASLVGEASIGWRQAAVSRR